MIYKTIFCTHVLDGWPWCSAVMYIFPRNVYLKRLYDYMSGTQSKQWESQICVTTGELKALPQLCR